MSTPKLTSLSLLRGKWSIIFSVFGFFGMVMLFLFSTSQCTLAKTTYSIGIDPGWSFSRVKGKEAHVSAFVTELLGEISQMEKVHFQRIDKSWDNLLACLQDKDCQGVITTLYPYLFYFNKYAFSELFLSTGPVVVMRNAEVIDVLEEMEGCEIVVGSQSYVALVSRLYPQATVRYYPAIPKALNELTSGGVDAVVLDCLLAKSFIENLYGSKLKIVSKPLNDEGLRLMTLREGGEDLLETFHAGMKKVQERGIYKTLLKKWDLLLD